MMPLVVAIAVNVAVAAINAGTWFYGVSGDSALFCSGINVGCAFMLSVVVAGELAS